MKSTNRNSVAHAIFEMARAMEGPPIRRAYRPTIDDDGSEGEEEVPLGTEGAQVWATVEARWPLPGQEIEWSICECEEDGRFEKRRAAAIAAAMEIASMMVRGKTYKEAEKAVLEEARGVWEGDLPAGWSSSKVDPWWII